MSDLRIIALLVAPLFFIGCAAAQSPSALNQMQIKIAQLERRIDERDEEIKDLKDQIQGVQNDVETEDNLPIEESHSSTRMKAPDLSVSEAPDLPLRAEDKDIVRVSAAPKQIQTALKNAGYYKGTIDGKIGQNTRKAIEVFQKDHHLKSDGIIGKKTWDELKNYLD